LQLENNLDIGHGSATIFPKEPKEPFYFILQHIRPGEEPQNVDAVLFFIQLYRSSTD